MKLKEPKICSQDLTLKKIWEAVIALSKLWTRLAFTVSKWARWIWIIFCISSKVAAMLACRIPTRRSSSTFFCEVFRSSNYHRQWITMPTKTKSCTNSWSVTQQSCLNVSTKDNPPLLIIDWIWSTRRFQINNNSRKAIISVKRHSWLRTTDLFYLIAKNNKAAKQLDRFYNQQQKTFPFLFIIVKKYRTNNK